MDRLIQSVAAVVAALLVGGCRDHPPRIVVGDVRVLSPGATRVQPCLRRYPELHPSRIVARYGPLGGSLTIAERGSPLLYACDFRAGGTRVCGGAVGVWRRGRLNDPRLDLGCTGVAAAWVVPVRHARSIAVREGTRIEIYPTAAKLPVRIWTRHVDVARSSAVFDVSQRARDGTPIARERIRAFVAG